MTPCRPMPEVVVVGAGIIGASIARFAAERAAAVTVVDAARPASGTSLATFAWVNAAGKQPRAYFDLNVAGIAAHRELVERLGGGEWYHAGGNLEWGPADAVTERATRHREWGYAVETIDAAEARRLEPAARIGPDDGSAFSADDAWVDPVLLVARLLDDPHITTLPGTRVTAIATDGGRATGVALADGRRIAADVVVVATGPDAAELVAPLGLDLPMRHAPGLMAVTEPVAVPVGRIIHAPGISFRPDGAGRLLLAADGVDKQLDVAGGPLSVDAAADELLARTRRAISGLDGIGFEALRIGRRALTADGYPAVGPVPGTDGAYLAVTHSGVTLAPHLGQLVARELLDDLSDPTLDDYRPGRFAAAAHAPQP